MVSVEEMIVAVNKNPTETLHFDFDDVQYKDSIGCLSEDNSNEILIDNALFRRKENTIIVCIKPENYERRIHLERVFRCRKVGQEYMSW